LKTLKRKMVKIALSSLLVALLLPLTLALLFTAKPAGAAWGGASFTLTVDVSPSGNGNIKINENTLSTYPLTSTFASGTKLQLEALPAPGYSFTNWSGALSGSDNPATITIDCTKSVTANFGHTLTMQVSGNGSSTPTAGAHGYDEGTVVTITATPEDGWRFDSWSGGVAEPKSSNTTVTMSSDKTITANFSKTTAIQGNWPLIGGIIGGLVVVGVLVVLLVHRQRAF
jgi:hypothetical protein